MKQMDRRFPALSRQSPSAHLEGLDSNGSIRGVSTREVSAIVDESDLRSTDASRRAPGVNDVPDPHEVVPPEDRRVNDHGSMSRK